MNVGVLTSSRADFGIYLPLLDKLKTDTSLAYKIIAFGTHCSAYHGRTIQEIKQTGHDNIDQISSLLADDSETSIATSYGLTAIKFAEYWSAHNFDIVFCLGDRFEMSAAVQAGIPFGITFAHIHGGETTLGAIDNTYRHQLSIASRLHFTSTQEYAEKVKILIDSDKHVYNVGALSLDGIEEINLVDEHKLRDQYSIPEGKFILTTFHPETVKAKKNKHYAKEMGNAIKSVMDDWIIVITMPNADTRNSYFRRTIQGLEELYPKRIVTVENFGKRDYFSAMQYSRLLLGNTSSGIIEAASFNKYAINVGDRQKGRSQSDNVINCKFRKEDMVDAIRQTEKLGEFTGQNIYKQKDTADKIINLIKSYNETL